MGANQRDDFRVRAYLLSNTLQYIRETPAVAGILPQLSPAVLEAAGESGAGDWCPGELYVDVLRKLAASANGDQQRAQELLIESGAYVARAASNTFLRLLMKVLTPALFARKLPDFWRRDCSVGHLEVEVAPPRITCRFVNMPGFEHATCTGAGFLRHAFQGMGKSIQQLELHNWSLAQPAADVSTVTLVWAS